MYTHAHTPHPRYTPDRGQEFHRTGSTAVQNTMLEVVFLQIYTATGRIVTQFTLLSCANISDVMDEQVPVTVYLLLKLQKTQNPNKFQLCPLSPHSIFMMLHFPSSFTFLN